MASIETRSYGGYATLSSTMGRTRVEIICPFCSARVIAYLWSLAGSGKRCECGVKFDHYGNARKAIGA